MKRGKKWDRNGVERMVLLSVTLPPWSVSRILHGQCMAAGSYSGTHEDDGKIAKTRDVTLNHRNTFHNAKVAAENLLSLIVELRSSPKRG